MAARITIEQLVDILRNGNEDGYIDVLSYHVLPDMLQIEQPTCSDAYLKIVSTGEETVTFTIKFTRALELCNKDNTSGEVG